MSNWIVAGPRNHNMISLTFCWNHLLVGAGEAIMEIARLKVEVVPAILSELMLLVHVSATV